MHGDNPVRVGIIGAGRLGSTLAMAMMRAGYRVEAVSSRRPESAQQLGTLLGPAVCIVPPQLLVDRCDLVFVTVPDAAIAEVTSGLSWRRDQWVVHCSGALDLGALSAAAARGALVGCFHPLQSFSSADGSLKRFDGIFCGIEALEPLSAVMEELASRLGARIVRLEGVDRSAYHAAAVFASNYVVALMSAAEEAWRRAGLTADSARGALVPLLLGAAENVAAHELHDALTGPVARGDIETVRRHLAVLGDSELGDLYRRLGAQLLTLDLRHDEATVSALREALATRPG